MYELKHSKIGVLSPESAKRLEKVIKERREKHKEMHLSNVKRVAHAFRQREWQLF